MKMFVFAKMMVFLFFAQLPGLKCHLKEMKEVHTKKKVELRTAEHPILFVGRLRIVNSSFNIEHQIVTLNNDCDCK